MGNSPVFHHCLLLFLLFLLRFWGMWWQMARLSVKSKVCSKLFSVVPCHPSVWGTGGASASPQCFSARILSVVSSFWTAVRSSSCGEPIQEQPMSPYWLLHPLETDFFRVTLLFHQKWNYIIKWGIDEEGDGHKVEIYSNILKKL